MDTVNYNRAESIRQAEAIEVEEVLDAVAVLFKALSFKHGD